MAKRRVKEIIEDALTAARRAGDLKVETIPEWTLETLPSPEQADYSTNVAVLLGRQEQLEPQEVAARIVKHLPVGRGPLARAEIAGAGFIHLFLSPDWLLHTVRQVLQEGASYGRSERGAGRRVQVEFVSADPTGPLHVGHGRAAVFGDVLARLLEWTGWQVTREYYINDATCRSQILNLSQSLDAHYQQALGREAVLPVGSYEGEYIAEVARALAKREGDRYLSLPEAERSHRFTEVALAEMLARHRNDLRRLGVAFDVWFSEQTLLDSNAVEETLDVLQSRGAAYEAEGALWLRSTAFGDEHDHVLRRGNGAPTYLAGDIAYHRDKFRRGFDRVIDIWGPDHQVHVARTRAAVAALGIDPERLEILILQPVRLLKEGVVVHHSRDTGTLFPLADLLNEVGAEAARFFFLLRDADSVLDFDLDLARKQTPENPLYQVRTAYERTGHLLRQAPPEASAIHPGESDWATLDQEDAEHCLMRLLDDFPEEVGAAAEKRQVHRLACFAQELADALHTFCDIRVPTGQEAPPRLTGAPLALVQAGRIVLGNALALLGFPTTE